MNDTGLLCLFVKLFSDGPISFTNIAICQCPKRPLSDTPRVLLAQDFIRLLLSYSVKFEPRFYLEAAFLRPSPSTKDERQKRAI